MIRKTQRKTGKAFRYNATQRKWEPCGEITCEARDTNEDGSRIWVDLASGQRFLLFRDGKNKRYFTHI